MKSSLAAFKKVSILIAAYNEEATLKPCVERVLAAPLPNNLEREIILVDDGSHDETWTLAQQLASQEGCIRIFQQPINQGKGAALRRGIKEITGEVAIFQDADLEYDPSDYGRLFRPILDGRADMVYGSRFIGEERKILYYWHTAGNQLLTTLSNMLNDTNLTDMETCYKAISVSCLRAMPLESNRFGIEPEITAKAARNRFRIYEVPISYNGRTYHEGKKIGWRDGFAALWFILKYRFSSHYAQPGKVALDALEQAPRFNRWMYETIKPYLGKRLVELGAGRGNISWFLKKHGPMLLTDFDEEYLAILGQKWGYLSRIRVARVDLTEAKDFLNFKDFSPDTVVCLNVLEHIENDQAVLDRLHTVLPEACRLVFLVPFNPKLYSEFDRQIGHFRRYQKGELEAKMQKAGFCVERQLFFNKMGVLAWWFGNTCLKQRAITSRQLKLYNLLTPAFRMLDPWLPMAGLSTVVIARK